MIDKIVVSTDDPEISHVAQTFGAEVPFLRPKKLAHDTSPAIDTVLHAISQLPNYQRILLLQPTSPLRKADDIKGIINFALSHNADSAVSVSEAPKHPFWTFELKDNKLIPFVKHKFVPCRQDLPPAYSLNGSLFFASKDWIVKTRTLVGPETIAYKMNKESSVDIDDLYDWNVAETLLRSKISPTI